MDNFTLVRSGDRPLSFSGDLLASVSTETTGTTRGRWHELALYQTEGGSFVLQIVGRSKWDNEVESHQVTAVKNPVDLVPVLHAYDPTASFLGYPLGTQYEEKQRRLMADLRRRYDAAVSQLLKFFPEVVE